MAEQTQTKTTQSGSIIGRVVSNKMDKTVVVLIERKTQHPLYKKYIRRSTKLFAHDPENVCNEGDIVRICQGSPKSKKKSWELVGVLEKARVQNS